MSRMSVNLSVEMEELIEETAKAQGISKGEVIRKAFALFKLAESEKKKGRTLALVDQDDPTLRVIAKIIGV